MDNTTTIIFVIIFTIVTEKVLERFARDANRLWKHWFDR